MDLLELKQAAESAAAVQMLSANLSLLNFKLPALSDFPITGVCNGVCAR